MPRNAWTHIRGRIGSEQGFGLIEVLVAGALTIFLLTPILFIHNLASSAEGREDAHASRDATCLPAPAPCAAGATRPGRISSIANARTLLARMTREIRSASMIHSNVYTNSNGPWDANTPTTGQGFMLDFETTVSQASGPPVQREVCYFLFAYLLGRREGPASPDQTGGTCSGTQVFVSANVQNAMNQSAPLFDPDTDDTYQTDHCALLQPALPNPSSVKIDLSFLVRGVDTHVVDTVNLRNWNPSLSEDDLETEATDPC